MVLENDPAGIARNLAITRNSDLLPLIPSTVALIIAEHTPGAKHLFVTSGAAQALRLIRFRIPH